jgi:hypothetical protein
MGVKSPQVGDMKCLCPWEHPHSGTLPYTHLFLSSTPKSVCVFSFQGKHGIVDILRFRVLHRTTNKQVGFPCDEWFHVKTDTVIHKHWGAPDLVFQVLYEQIWLIPWRLCIYVLVMYWLENTLGIVKGAVVGISVFFFFSFFLFFDTENLAKFKPPKNQT